MTNRKRRGRDRAGLTARGARGRGRCAWDRKGVCAARGTSSGARAASVPARIARVLARAASGLARAAFLPARATTFRVLTPSLSAAVVALVSAASVSPATAQAPDSVLAPAGPSATDPDRGAPDRRTVVGVALSGGSAKGFAHVGVLRVLEEAGVRVEVVAGTSMGSVIGGLYAIGLPIDSIVGLIQGVDWPTVIGDGTTRDRRFLDQRRFDERAVATLPLTGGIVSLPTGAVAGSNIVRLAEQATWRAATTRSFDRLRRPFAAIATNIETGEAVTLRTGVLSEALRASTGIPGAIEPIELDRRLLVDGALSRNLPATDARELGADYVICSDVSDPLLPADQLGSLIDVLDQVSTLTMRQSLLEQREHCDLLIRPDVEGISGFSFDRYEEWFERGRLATEPLADTLRALAAAQGPPPPLGVPRPVVPDSVRVVSVTIRGTSGPDRERFVRGELRVTPGAFVTSERLASRLSDIDATGLFGLVRYRLDGVRDGVALTVDVREQPKDRLGVGLRYDDERRAALLFTSTLHNVVGYGSVTRLDLRVGEETRARASYRLRRGVTGRFEGGGSVSWSQADLPLAAAAGGTTQYEFTKLGVFVGLVAGRTSFVGLEGDLEWAVVGHDAIDNSLLVSATAVLDHESLDRIDFPRSGTDVTGRWESGSTDVENGEGFSVLTGSARVYVPLHRRVTLEVGGFVGVAGGLDLPVHRTFFVGGQHRSPVFGGTHPLFLGLGRGALQGTHASIGRGALRVEVREGLFLRVAADVGAATAEWEFPVRDPVVGIGASVGLSTLLGPVTLEWSRADLGGGSRLSVGVGRVF